MELWQELLRIFGITGPMAIVLIVFGISLITMGAIIIKLLVKQTDQERRLNVQGDYFDVQIDWNSHTHKASLQALAKAAKAEGSVETLISMAKKSKSH